MKVSNEADQAGSPQEFKKIRKTPNDRRRLRKKNKISFVEKEVSAMKQQLQQQTLLVSKLEQAQLEKQAQEEAPRVKEAEKRKQEEVKEAEEALGLEVERQAKEQVACSKEAHERYLRNVGQNVRIRELFKQFISGTPSSEEQQASAALLLKQWDADESGLFHGSLALANSTFINDLVMFDFAKTILPLHYSGRRVVVIDSLATKKVLDEGVNAEIGFFKVRVDGKSGLRSDTSDFAYHLDPERTHKIVFVVNLNFHWFVVCFNMVEHTCYVMDSLGGAQLSVQNKLAAWMVAQHAAAGQKHQALTTKTQALQDWAVPQFLQTPPISDFSPSSLICPQQQDGVSCGLFAITFVYFILVDQERAIEQCTPPFQTLCAGVEATDTLRPYLVHIEEYRHTLYRDLLTDKTRLELIRSLVLQKEAVAGKARDQAKLQEAEARSLQAEDPIIAPTGTPSEAPSTAPSGAPTQAPTAAPTQAPSNSPTQAPTIAPTGTTSEEARSLQETEEAANAIDQAKLQEAEARSLQETEEATRARAEARSLQEAANGEAERSRQAEKARNTQRDKAKMLSWASKRSAKASNQQRPCESADVVHEIRLSCVQGGWLGAVFLPSTASVADFYNLVAANAACMEGRPSGTMILANVVEREIIPVSDCKVAQYLAYSANRTSKEPLIGVCVSSVEENMQRKHAQLSFLQPMVAKKACARIKRSRSPSPSSRPQQHRSNPPSKPEFQQTANENGTIPAVTPKCFTQSLRDNFHSGNLTIYLVRPGGSITKDMSRQLLDHQVRWSEPSVAYAALNADLQTQRNKVVGLDTEGILQKEKGAPFRNPLMIQLSGLRVIVLEIVFQGKLSKEACCILESEEILKCVYGDDSVLFNGICRFAHFSNLQEQFEDRLGLAQAVSQCSSQAWSKEKIFEKYKLACTTESSSCLLQIKGFGFYAAADAWFTLWLHLLLQNK